MVSYGLKLSLTHLALLVVCMILGFSCNNCSGVASMDLLYEGKAIVTVHVMFDA